jgi:rRNA processing protein Krr1/Pno1
VLAGSRVHILGAFENIGMARERYVSGFHNPIFKLG